MPRSCSGSRRSLEARRAGSVRLRVRQRRSGDHDPFRSTSPELLPSAATVVVTFVTAQKRRDHDIFDGAFTIDGLDTDDETAAGPTGQVQRAVCTLGQRITCVDSPIGHDCDMTPTISLFVECGDENELERLFVALAEDREVFMPVDDDGFSRRDGWVHDRFGVPWQLNPRELSRPDRTFAIVADRHLGGNLRPRRKGWR